VEVETIEQGTTQSAFVILIYIPAQPVMLALEVPAPLLSRPHSMTCSQSPFLSNPDHLSNLMCDTTCQLYLDPSIVVLRQCLSEVLVAVTILERVCLQDPPTTGFGSPEYPQIESILVMPLPPARLAAGFLYLEYLQAAW